MAYRLGDPTARNAGRLTLNPLKHIDPFSTILLPILLRLAGFIPLIIFKPVPVDPRYFKNPRRDGILVALAGPGTNILLILLTVALTRILGALLPAPYPVLYVLFKQVAAPFFILVNMILAAFNLMPFPPLDGSWILKGLLPEKARLVMERYNTYFVIIFLVLLLSGRISFVFRFILKFLDGLIVRLIG